MAENKPIIVDRVDVSGCEAYKVEHCKDKTSIMFCNTNLCSNFPNCYFKQLARKTQECEELREELDKAYEDIKLSPLCYKCSEEDCLRKEIDKLKATKEQAEQKLERVRQMLKNGVKIHDDIIVNKSILQIIDEVE